MQRSKRKNRTQQCETNDPDLPIRTDCPEVRLFTAVLNQALYDVVSGLIWQRKMGRKTEHTETLDPVEIDSFFRSENGTFAWICEVISKDGHTDTIKRAYREAFQLCKKYDRTARRRYKQNHNTIPAMIRLLAAQREIE